MQNEQVYSRQEQAVIRRIAGMMIGPSQGLGLPGADDDVVAAKIIQRAARVEVVFKMAIDSMLALDEDVAAISDEDFAGRVDRLKGAHAGFIDTLILFTAQSYYEDARVLTSLNKEARPPFPKGHVLEQGDWSLLDPVKKMSSLYRKIE